MDLKLSHSQKTLHRKKSTGRTSRTTGGILQQEADELLALPKYPDNPAQEYLFPCGGGKLEIPFHDKQRRENFILNLTQSAICSVQLSLNHRVRGNIILCRLDLGGQYHTNPDGTRLSRNHIHIYKEGFNDRYAYNISDVIPEIDIQNMPFTEITKRFLEYCKVLEMPNITTGIFPEA